MAREKGWERLVCDGTSEHCVVTAFAREDDEKSNGNWHTCRHVTKDGEEMEYFLCDSCYKEWMAISEESDRAVNEFIKVKE